MAEHLLTEDSDFGSIPTENGQRRIRVWAGLTANEAAWLKARLHDPANQLRSHLERSLAVEVSRAGYGIAVIYGSDHPFGAAPITRAYDDPNPTAVPLLGELCTARIEEILRRL